MCYIEDEPTAWTLYFYESKCSCGAGVGIFLAYPKNEVIPMDYKLGFEGTINIIEYEALILGLKVAVTLKIKDLEIYGDSQLLVNQVQDIFDTKDEKLIPYKIVVNDLFDQFDR